MNSVVRQINTEVNALRKRIKALTIAKKVLGGKVQKRKAKKGK